MDYLAVLFLSHLAHVTEEVRFVDGMEQPCLVIPTYTNQMSRGRSGLWKMSFIFKEQKMNPKGISHLMKLIYFSPEHTQEAKRKGTWEQTMRMGRLFPRIYGLTVDRTNPVRDIRLDGVIVLSDIPKQAVKAAPYSRKRFVGGLTMKSKSDENTIYTGAVCVDDIPKDKIKTNPANGKKYIITRLLKMDKMDYYDNTHVLMLVSDSGAEIEIGKFKEWVKDGQNPNQPNPVQENQYNNHRSDVNQRQGPESIDGLKF